MDDLISEFLTETSESLGELDNALVLLEQNPNDDALISKIFRFIHTIKGTCGFLGLSRLEKVAHKGEDVLGLFRDKKLQVTPEYISLILQSIDRIKEIVIGLETSGQEPQGDDNALIARLEAVYSGSYISSPTAIEWQDGGIIMGDNTPPVSAFVETELRPTEAGALPEPAAPKTELSDSGLTNQSIRVSVDVLENLMTMVSELVLTRNQLLQTARQYKDDDIHARMQRLNHVVSELQDGVMKTRMQPIGNAWAKLPRIVRDVCAELGKKIDLEMHGQETELDRQVLDLIKDPLTHMVRNSADHGIERPADRLMAGKPETGKIILKSYHEGGHIIIQISDDGKGLSLGRIKQKILDNRLASDDQLAVMSVQQIQQYIFHAGFSTAEKITAVSGRGVGMDVVRSNIQKIGGSIELHSVENKGTIFTIKIPLTLAIVSSLIVGVGDERFAIPQLSVAELVMVNHDSEHQIEWIANAPVFRLRQMILPLVNLRDLLKLEKNNAQDQKQTDYIIVLNIAGFTFGLVVEKVFDMEEIVIKPVSENFKTIQIFSGNTILGDGQVIMILDVNGVLNASGINRTGTGIHDTPVENDLPDKVNEQLLLLFRAGDQTLKAIEISRISRLEELDIETIETADGRDVIQYLGQLMPVHAYDENCVRTASRCPLIIMSYNNRTVGLMADKILDIAPYHGIIQHAGHKVFDSVIINGQATDIVNPEWFTMHGVALEQAVQA